MQALEYILGTAKLLRIPDIKRFFPVFILFSLLLGVGNAVTATQLAVQLSQSSTGDAPKIDAQLLARADALEQQAEQETQAIDALTLRIDQLELKVERLVFAVESVLDRTESRQATMQSARLNKPLSETRNATAEADGGVGNLEATANFGSFFTEQFPLVYWLVAIGGLLIIFLLIFVLRFYQRKYGGLAISVNKSTGSSAGAGGARTCRKVDKKYLQTISELAALRKAAKNKKKTAQNTRSENPHTNVIQFNQRKQEDRSISNKRIRQH